MKNKGNISVILYTAVSILTAVSNTYAQNLSKEVIDRAYSIRLNEIEKKIKSDNLDLQNSALYDLYAIHGHKKIEFVNSLLKSSDVSIRSNALRALKEGSQQELKIILNAMKDSAEEVKAAAISALSFQKNTAEALKILKPALNKESSFHVKIAATVAYVKLQGPESEKILREGLVSTEKETRFAAFQALEFYKGPDNLQLIGLALKDQSQYAWLSENVANRLINFKNPEALQLIEIALNNSNQFTRSKATLALVNHQGPAAEQLLEKASKDSSEQVKRAAATALGTHSGQHAVRILNNIFHNSDHQLTRAEAVLSLRNYLNEPEALQIVNRALNMSYDEEIFKASLKTIALYNNDYANNILEKALKNNGNDETRTYAANALANYQGNNANKLFEIAFSDAHRDVRLGATIALRNYNYPDALNFFEKALADADQLVRYHAILSLETYAGPRSLKNKLIKRLMDSSDSNLKEDVVKLLVDYVGSDKFNLIAKALNDSSKIVRYSALKALVKHSGPEVDKLLEIALNSSDLALKFGALDHEYVNTVLKNQFAIADQKTEESSIANTAKSTRAKVKMCKSLFF
jgi:HEAT repeat protein